MIEEHDLIDIDMSHYTPQMWFDEIHHWLVSVMGMNQKQVKAEFDKRFPELLKEAEQNVIK